MNSIEIQKYFIKALNEPKAFEKEDIIRVAEGLGIEVNKRIGKRNLIDLIIDKGFYNDLYQAFEEFIYIPVWEVADYYHMNTSEIDKLKDIGAITHTPQEKEFYSRRDKCHFKANTYPIDILSSYDSEKLKKAYTEAYIHTGYRLRLETDSKEEIEPLVNEFKKGFKVGAVDIYEKRNEGYNSYFTIEKLNGTKYEGNAMLLEIQKLKNEIQELKNENRNIRKTYGALIAKQTSKVNESNNPRGAGRKQKLDSTDIENIKMHRLQGKTIKEIAIIYNCSVGLIHKLINEK